MNKHLRTPESIEEHYNWREQDYHRLVGKTNISFLSKLCIVPLHQVCGVAANHVRESGGRLIYIQPFTCCIHYSGVGRSTFGGSSGNVISLLCCYCCHVRAHTPTSPWTLDEPVGLEKILKAC